MAKTNHQEERRFLVIVALSVLLHFLVLVIYVLAEPQFDKITPRQIEFKVQLRSKEPEKEPLRATPVPKKEIAKDNRIADKPKPRPKEKNEKLKDLSREDPDAIPDSYSSKDVEASANQTNKDVGDLVQGGRAKTKKRKNEKVAEKISSGVITSKSSTDRDSNISGISKDHELEAALDSVYGDFEEYAEHSESEGEFEEGIESDYQIDTLEELNNDATEIGNTKLLRDSELAKAFIEDPFSENKSREVKIINKYFKHIQETILDGWVNPLSEGQIRKGPVVEIVFELSSEGYIRFPKVKLQSIFPQLDESLIQRLEEMSNHKFAIHKSYINKYKYLRMTWSGATSSHELMPFEVDK